MRNIQTLNVLQLRKARRNRSHKSTIAAIKHGHVLKVPDLRREATTEVVPSKDHLLNSRHHPNAMRDTPCQIVESQCDNAHSGVPKILRNGAREPVVVQEQRIEPLPKDLRRQTTFKVVEPKVNELGLFPAQHCLRERPHEPVVADIELVHDRHVAKRLGNDPAKPVRVEMQQGQVSQQPQLRGEVPSDVSVVEIDTSDDIQFRAVDRLGAEDSRVRANIRPNPCSRDISRVRVDALLPRL
ncbi:hypothetical protein LINPERHAP2_LOCUS7733 [Linum perenne]